MSFGTSPSTMTVDPTPPGLRPMQNQLVQMLMSRLSGQGRSSVPTYGSNTGNIQQQLYGVNPHTPPTSQYPGGEGPMPGQGQIPGNTNPLIPPGGSSPPPSTPAGPRVPIGPRYGGIGDPIPMYGGIVDRMAPGFGQPTDLVSSTPPATLAMPPSFGDMTRGGPMGMMQGGTNPWSIPTFGSMMNGSGMIRSRQNPYGYY